MGQYYKFVILNDTKKNGKEVIILYINPHKYNEGAKLMEHSYVNTDLLNTVEFLLSKYGPFYKSRIVWAGDYAEEEEGYKADDCDGRPNLYYIAENYSSYSSIYNKNDNNKYIVNHTKQLYTQIKQSEDNQIRHNQIHPLPLLVEEGNGSGGGDYDGHNQKLCGTWARDIISIEEEIPDNYSELVCDFEEY